MDTKNYKNLSHCPIHGPYYSGADTRMTRTGEEVRGSDTCPNCAILQEKTPLSRNKAPWPDFSGKPIYEGDTILHPSLKRGVVTYSPERSPRYDQWHVDYGNDIFPLKEQVNESHQGIVVSEEKDVSPQEEAPPEVKWHPLKVVAVCPVHGEYAVGQDGFVTCPTCLAQAALYRESKKWQEVRIDPELINWPSPLPGGSQIWLTTEKRWSTRTAGGTEVAGLKVEDDWFLWEGTLVRWPAKTSEFDLTPPCKPAPDIG